MKRIGILLFIGFLLGKTALGQEQFNNVSVITSLQGLPSSYCVSVAEDKNGFIWVGTLGGLARFDGSSVIAFTSPNKDAPAIPSSYIKTLHVSGDSLWIGHRKGLSVLDLNSGDIYNHTFILDHIEKEQDAASIDDIDMVWDIMEDRNRNIWMAPSHAGFVKWDRQKEEFMVFPVHTNDTLPQIYSQRDQTTMMDLIHDVKHDSIVWGVGLGGLVRMNTETGTYQRILYPKGDKQLKFEIDRKICLYQAKDEKIYTGSWGGGLSIYDPNEKQYSYPRIENADIFIKPGGRDHLHAIMPGEPGFLYLTFTSGLYYYNIATKNVQLVKKHMRKSAQKILFGAKFKDSKGRIWYPHGDGLLVLDPMVHQYRWFDMAELNPTSTNTLLRSIVEDFYPGYVTIGGQYMDGIYHFNLETGHSFKHEYLSKLNDVAFFDSGGLSKINDSTLLIITRKRLYILDKHQDEIREVEIKDLNAYPFFTSVAVDEAGIVWLGNSKEGLIRLNLQTDEVKLMQKDSKVKKASLLFRDSKNNIWSISDFGHSVYDAAKEALYVFDYNQDSTNTFLVGRNFCKCPNGEVWWAGREAGLGLLSPAHPEKGILKKIIPTNERGNRVWIQRIACNAKNELWAIGSGGLLKINREDFTVKTFNTAYGANKWYNGFEFLKNGDLFLGARNGFYTVNPDELVINEVPPKPYVSKVSSNLGMIGRVEDYIHKDPIKLSVKERLLNIEFSAINHTLADRTKYLYKLEGLDDDWIDPGKDRSLYYSYLPGGNYTFKVKACNNEGIWSEEVYELPIHIATPWYRSALFIFACIMAVLGLLYAYYRSRIQQIRRENELKSKFEKRVAGLEMSALRAQMNPHFVFNCLNSIEAYIIRNDTRKASEYLNTFGRLVRLILQNSRSAYISLQDELESLQLYIELEQMRFKDSFTYEIEVAEEVNPEVYEIPPMLLQPFVENAIWHGLNHKEIGGQLKIGVRTDAENLVCVIEDNGIGRVAAAEIRAAQKIKRKSMGLGITMERIETLNKAYQTSNEIQIEDLYNQDGAAAGTRVTLIIPL